MCRHRGNDQTVCLLQGSFWLRVASSHVEIKFEIKIRAHPQLPSSDWEEMDSPVSAFNLGIVLTKSHM